MVHVSMIPERLFEVFGLPITNSLLTSWLVLAGIVIFSVVFSKKLTDKMPGRVQNVLELAVEKLFNFMVTFASNKENAKKYFPLSFSIFIFILLSNWVGILPGVGSIGIFETHGEKPVLVPFFRSVYSDLNMTLALAIIVMTTVHVVGIATVGVGRHLGKYLTVRSFGDSFAGILELVGEISKIISFSFRLFGNVFAGEVLLVVMTFLVPYIAPVPFYGLEIFVGFIQALIFSVLTMLFLSAATQIHAESH